MSRSTTPVDENKLNTFIGQMLSDLGGAVTGEIHYVDGGFNALGMPQNLDEVLAAMSRSTD